MAGAEAEIQAGGVALCRGQTGARRVAQHGAGRADRAAQPDPGQPDRGQHLRQHPPSRGRLSMRDGRRHGALAPAFRRGAAAGAAGQARHLHRGRWRPRRHGGGRRGAHAGVEVARPRQRQRRHQLLDRLSRHSLRAAHRGDVLRAVSRAAGWRRSPAKARRRCASRRTRRSGRGATPRRSRSART